MESTKEELAKHLEEAELDKATLRKELDQVYYHSLKLVCLHSHKHVSYTEVERTEFYINISLAFHNRTTCAIR